MTAKTTLTPPNNTRFFTSWSGGKDSCLALHRAFTAGAKPAYLLTMIGEDGVRSRSHGLRRDVLEAQAAAMRIPLIIKCTAWSRYKDTFIDVLHEIRKQGVKAGVFGDIDSLPHREWDEKVCAKTDMRAYLPLWRCDRLALLREFLALGYKALIVSVKEKKLDRKFLGKIIDKEIIAEFQKAGIDPCGENGEYHTLVVDGPLFSRPLLIETGAIRKHCGYRKHSAYHMLDVRL
jgi:uncharacterized protein (TIGR00290 family)